MINLDLWLDKYITAVDSAFGSRIVFTGIQGSYARGEAHNGSENFANQSSLLLE